MPLTIRPLPSRMPVMACVIFGEFLVNFPVSTFCVIILGSLVCYFLFSFEVPRSSHRASHSCLCSSASAVIVCPALIIFTWSLSTCPALCNKDCVFPLVFFSSLCVLFDAPMFQPSLCPLVFSSIFGFALLFLDLTGFFGFQFFVFFFALSLWTLFAFCWLFTRFDPDLPQLPVCDFLLNLLTHTAQNLFCLGCLPLGPTCVCVFSTQVVTHCDTSFFHF